MIVLKLGFSDGRFHATPWGRNVNEGMVEWPPSPWRLLRALIATWHLKAKDIPEALVRAIVDNLSSPPGFFLPPALALHTRHFMPGNETTHKENKKEVFGPTKTKIFDTFVQIPSDKAILMAWDVTLPPDQLAALKTLALRLGYFGRAESLATLQVEEMKIIDANSVPLPDDTPLPEHCELVRVLCAKTQADYEQWRTEFVSKILETDEKPKSKPSKVIEPPMDLFTALHADTGKLQEQGWNIPPGAIFVNYTRREDAFAPVFKPVHHNNVTIPTMARYTLVSTVPPRITKAVSIANLIHKALCKLIQGDASVFSGLDGNKVPLKGHSHAYIFCEANGPRDVISHITIWSQNGFNDNALLALRMLNSVKKFDSYEIRLVLHGIGTPEDFAECTLFKESKTWRSLTPFVSTRHAKTFGKGRPKLDEKTGIQIGSPEHDLKRLLTLENRFKGFHVIPNKEITLNTPGSILTLRCLQFQTIRCKSGGSRGQDFGKSFTLQFPQKIPGPIALGYAAHFGLGLFVPVEESEEKMT